MLSKKRHQSGLGLVEVMASAAILGGLSLVVMKMNEQGTQGVARVERGLEASDFD
jgi:Tfp pilus assembly protein PilE